MIETSGLAKLVFELLIIAQAYTGFGPPERPPEVAFVSAAELQQRACDRPCEIYGFFPPGRLVLLDDRLDPLRNIAARGILLHELVHFLQQESGAFGPETTCRRWLDREHQAFEVQLRWLADQNAPLGALGRAPGMPMHVACVDDGGGPRAAKPLG